ncbi:MAG: hypothetical protein SLRJCFUN_001974, partial [Candidatus Fervidibacter sp.]
MPKTLAIALAPTFVRLHSKVAQRGDCSPTSIGNRLAR